MKHYCHAEICNVETQPKMLMCKRHWNMLSQKLKDQIWEHYRPGQEIDKDPSSAYLKVMKEAISYISNQEPPKYCGAVNPDNQSQKCERFGRCGQTRKHIAVDRRGQGKAQIIEFQTEDQDFSSEDLRTKEVPRQGSLF